MIILTDRRQLFDVDWELLEVNPIKNKKEEKVYQELWINRYTNDQEIIERRLKENG